MKLSAYRWRIIAAMSNERLQRHLLSGEEARNPENILALFEMLAHRQATNAERAELNRRATAAQATALNTAEHDLECHSDGGR